MIFMRGVSVIHTGVFFLQRILGMFLSLLITAGISQTYGPEVFGQYSYVSTLVLLIAPLLYSGIEPVLIRKLVESTAEHRQRILGSAFILVAALTLAALTLPLGYLWLVEAGNVTLLTLAFSLAVSYLPQAFFVLIAAFKVSDQTLITAIASLVGLLFSSVLKLMMIALHLPLLYILLCTSIETVGTALILVFAYWRSGGPTWRTSACVMREILQDTWQMILSSVIVLLFFRFTHLFLAKTSSSLELGNYAISFQLFNLLNALPQAFFSANFAKMSQLSVSDPPAYAAYCLDTLYLFTRIGLALCVGSFIFSEALIPLVFGSEYRAASLVFNILSVAAVFSFSASVRGQVIHLSHPQRLHVLNALVGLILLVPLNAWLTPQLGALGAALAVTFSFFFSGVASSFLYAPLRAFGIEQLRALAGLPQRRDS